MSRIVRSLRLVLGCLLVLAAIGAVWRIDRVDADSSPQPTLANPPAQTTSQSGTSSKSTSNSSKTLATSGASQTFDEQVDSFPSTYPPALIKPGDRLVFNGTITGRKYSDPRDETLPVTIDYSKNVQSLQAALAPAPKRHTPHGVHYPNCRGRSGRSPHGPPANTSRHRFRLPKTVVPPRPSTHW